MHLQAPILGTWRQEHQEFKFEVSLGYTRPCLRKDRTGDLLPDIFFKTSGLYHDFKLDRMMWGHLEDPHSILLYSLQGYPVWHIIIELPWLWSCGLYGPEHQRNLQMQRWKSHCVYPLGCLPTVGWWWPLFPPPIFLMTVSFLFRPGSAIIALGLLILGLQEIPLTLLVSPTLPRVVLSSNRPQVLCYPEVEERECGHQDHVSKASICSRGWVVKELGWFEVKSTTQSQVWARGGGRGKR